MPKEDESGVARTQKMVSVSEDYLAFLHDELAENQARLRETLGAGAADAMFDWCADKLITTAEKGKYSFHPIDSVVQRLSSWGMQVKVTDMEGKAEIEVQCPYADRIHPRLSSSTPKCPLGEYALGAIRLEEGKSQLVSNHLTTKGVMFTIDKQ
jgi:hypothetical protein